MWGHYQQVADLQLAVAESDLVRAQVHAAWIAEHEAMAGLPSGSEPFVSEMRRQAERVVGASTISVAADAVGSMGCTCGACHVRFDVDARLEHGGAHDLTEESPSSMLGQHVFAADHLWDGLVGPSDSMWVAGARGLVQAPWFGRQVEAELGGTEEVRQIVETLRNLGRRAEDESSAESRAAMYGAVLSQCAACHDLARKGRS
jgi:hypothetical protein